MMNGTPNALKDFVNATCLDKFFFGAAVNCRLFYGTRLGTYIKNFSVVIFKPIDGSDPSMYMVKGFYRYS